MEYQDDVDELSEAESSESSDSDSSDSESSDSSREDNYKDEEENTYDIFDELANLESMQENLSISFAENSMTHEEYNNEMLRINYYIDIRRKTYILTEENQKFINELRSTKEKLVNSYKEDYINETQFYIKYNDLLRTEYTILKMSESDDKSGKKQYQDLNLDITEKLERLHQEEIKQMRVKGSKLKVYPPKIPASYTDDDIELYYKNKQNGISQEFDKDIHDYIQEYTSYKQVIDYNSSSFEITTRIWNNEGGLSEYNYGFKTLKPLSSKISNIKSIENRSTLLMPDEQRYSDRVGTLASKMREMSRETLLSCIPSRTFKYMSFIEKLRENKQNMFKFKEHPENYQALKSILGEEISKYYKIESDKIFKDYIYSRPDWLFDSLPGDNISSYRESGSAGYLAFREGVDRNNLGDDLSGFITVKPMDDELFMEIQDKTGDKTSIVEVWELRVSLAQLVGDYQNKKDLVKRYISFEDYLSDLKEILIKNTKKLPRGKTLDVLLERIRKISYYLNYGEDPDLYIQNGHTSISELFKNRAEVYATRKNGVFLLSSLISKYFENSTDIVNKLEETAFNFSSSNYDYNISKILFILNNYQDKLKDVITGQVSGLDLLTFETPKVLPENDLDGITNIEDKISYLLEWKPSTSQYDYYKTGLESINHDILEFKKNNTDLNTLQINEILEQYSESIQWENTLKSYSILKVPSGYIENNYRLRYLLRQRNKFPSRRIYRLATISERIETQKELVWVFNICKVSSPLEYARITEIIIYKHSKSPEEYISNKELIKREYSKLCKYFTKFNVSTARPNPHLSLSGLRRTTQETVDGWNADDANVITPIISEFIITQGDFSMVDDVRLSIFIKNVDSESLIKYIKQMRGTDIEIYDNIILDEINNRGLYRSWSNYLKVIRQARSDKKLKELKEHQILINNTYIPPVVSLQKPDDVTLGKKLPGRENTVTPEFIKIGSYYISEGVYPNFKRYYSGSREPTDNYTRKDLEDLAGYFNVPIVGDLYELYSDIIKTKNEYIRKKTVSFYRKFDPIEYNTYYEYLKLPAKNVTYTTRPRIGVPEPGEVYSVVKDLQKRYGVPVKYSEYNIPIYSIELKRLVDDSFIIIEGPCIFTEDFGAGDLMTSDSYILVEYIDSRGKAKMFREGVSQKRIITKMIDELDTCSRFANKSSCDNENSYSLEVKGLKLKCKWLDMKCGAVLPADDTIKNFNIADVYFDTESLASLWKDALESSINYIENLVKKDGLTQPEIKLLTIEQKHRLYNYYISISQPGPEEADKPLISFNSVPVKSYTMLDIIGRPDNPPENKITTDKFLDSNYTSITIYKTKETQMKYPLPNIKIGTEYNIDGNLVIPEEYILDTDSFICYKKSTEDKVVYSREEFRSKTNRLVLTRDITFCYISNADHKLLKDVPGYYWNIEVEKYDEPVKDKQIFKDIITEIKTFVPTSFINPSGMLNGKPLIQKEDIFDAIGRTGFRTLTTSDDYIYQIKHAIPARLTAIKFAIERKIDINEMLKRIIYVELSDVIEEYENMNPKPTITKEKLTEIMEKAIYENDFDLIAKNYVRSVRAKIPQELLKSAKRIIDERPKPPDTKKIDDSRLPTPSVVKVNKNNYVYSGRR